MPSETPVAAPSRGGHGVLSVVGLSGPGEGPVLGGPPGPRGERLGLGTSTYESDPELFALLTKALPDALAGDVLTLSTVTGTASTARHLAAIQDARAALARAAAHQEPELIALDLRESLDALGSILGVIAPDELLGRIFSAFCIGK